MRYDWEGCDLKLCICECECEIEIGRERIPTYVQICTHTQRERGREGERDLVFFSKSFVIYPSLPINLIFDIWYFDTPTENQS